MQQLTIISQFLSMLADLISPVCKQGYNILYSIAPGYITGAIVDDHPREIEMQN